jgi:hypothetical protein
MAFVANSKKYFIARRVEISAKSRRRDGRGSYSPGLSKAMQRREVRGPDRNSHKAVLGVARRSQIMTVVSYSEHDTKVLPVVSRAEQMQETASVWPDGIVSVAISESSFVLHSCNLESDAIRGGDGGCRCIHKLTNT